jgi:hypothetical protein
VTRHGRKPEPAVLGVVGHELQLADPVFGPAFTGNQIRIANAGRIAKGQWRGNYRAGRISRTRWRAEASV